MKQAFIANWMIAFGLLPLASDADGLVAHWPLSADARDVGTHRLDGTTNGGVRFETSADGRPAARFDGLRRLHRDSDA